MDNETYQMFMYALASLGWALNLYLSNSYKKRCEELEQALEEKEKNHFLRELKNPRVN